MVPEAILAKAKSLGVPVTMNGKTVVYYRNFFNPDGEEPHDIAWDLYCSDQGLLEDSGLQIRDVWSDNDSVGGIIVEILETS